ncbi:MAG: NTP transferase domain-containing protein [Saprospiraceae bacterium]|nr:NTP transferase domain-containing protein [Saprospiraceae bacterium]
MKIIIPMAGRGSRLRPHTLTTPKPLFPIVGKPIVQRIVEDFNAAFPNQIKEVAFIIGDFGPQAEAQLNSIAAQIGAKASIYYQESPEGPAHAIYCAKQSLSGPCIVAFSDTLFKAEFIIDNSSDGMIWVQKIADPSAFGVVKTDENNIITEFVEKSPVFVSDKAIVGIYYFKDGSSLRNEIEYLIHNNIREKGEFQITSVLENMKNKGVTFYAGAIDEWLDCGNKDNVLDTTKRMLDIKQDSEQLIADDIMQENAIIIPPCYIGSGVTLRNAVVGPYVTIGSNSTIENSVIRESVIQSDTRINDLVLERTMIGQTAQVSGTPESWSIGDYTQIGT